MKCKWHECENEARTKSEFCSDTCSKRYRRNPDNGKSDTQPGQVSLRDIPEELVSPINDVPALQAKSLTRAELTNRIRAYPNDTWINSPEHTELMRRLKAYTIERLEAEGYFVPQWRRLQEVA
jgi:hypothetical protein